MCEIRSAVDAISKAEKEAEKIVAAADIRVKEIQAKTIKDIAELKKVATDNIEKALAEESKSSGAKGKNSGGKDSGSFVNVGISVEKKNKDKATSFVVAEFKRRWA